MGTPITTGPHKPGPGKPFEIPVRNARPLTQTHRRRYHQNAEWASIKYKQVEYLHDQVGEQFTGIISGLTGWGIYIELIESKCEGMARLENMKDDYYSFDERDYVIRGARTKQEYHLGDTVEIVVKSADLMKRQLDFRIIA